MLVPTPMSLPPPIRCPHNHARDRTSQHARPSASGASNGIYAIVYGKRGKVALSELHPRLNAVIQAAYLHMEGSIYLIDPYPDTIPYIKIKFMQEALEVGAEVAGKLKILKKFRLDHIWAHEIMALVSSFLCYCFV